MRVAVLRGGRSSEHEVSLRSGASVARGLATAWHEVVAVTIERDGRWLHEGSPLQLHPAGGLLDADGHLTDAGRATKQRVEDLTDSLAAPPYDALGADGLEELVASLEPVAARLEATGSR